MWTLWDAKESKLSDMFYELIIYYCKSLALSSVSKKVKSLVGDNKKESELHLYATVENVDKAPRDI